MRFSRLPIRWNSQHAKGLQPLCNQEARFATKRLLMRATS